MTINLIECNTISKIYLRELLNCLSIRNWRSNKLAMGNARVLPTVLFYLSYFPLFFLSGMETLK